MKRILRIILGVLLSLAILIPVAACGSATLETPVNIAIDSDTLLLTWEAVPNARSYRLEITNAAGGEPSENIVQRTSYNLAQLKEGDYDLRVRAVGGSKNDVFSDWSEKIPFKREKESGLLYTLVDGNRAYEVRSVGTATGELTIEDVYRGKPVVGIGEAAFRGSTKIETVVIPDGVTYLGASAFYNCAALRSVKLPKSVVSIGNAAFQQCSSLTEIDLPEGLTAIAPYTFAYCRKLVSLTLPETITEIGVSAFTNSGLEEIAIPDSVTDIASSAFRQADGLKSVTFGSGLKLVDYAAFYSCTALKELSFAPSYEDLVFGTHVFALDGALTKVELPEGTTSIDEYCFASATALAEVTIPESVTSVAQYAFTNTKLYNDQLQGSDDGLIYIDRWLVDAKEDWKKTVKEISETTFRAGTVGIAEAAFRYVRQVEAKDEEGNTIVDGEGNPKLVPEAVSCECLEGIRFPASFKYIGDYAFYHSPALARVIATYDPDLVSVGAYAFADCETLYNVQFANGLKEIGTRAFFRCGQLDNNPLNPQLLIPETVTRVGENAYYGTMLWKDKDITDGIVYAANWVVGYHIDPAFEGENSPPSTIELRQGTVGICDYAFYGDSILQNVVGLQNVTKIGKGAFAYCSSLSAANLSINLTKIEDYTFYKCSQLYAVSFPMALRSIGEAAFFQCSRLHEVDLSGTFITSIGAHAFRECLQMTKLSLGERLTSIGKYAFYTCMTIPEAEIPDSVTEMGERAFSDCFSLHTLKLGEGLEKISDHAFSGCMWLRELTIPETVKEIGSRAFDGCIRLRSVKFGNGLETIGDYAFCGDETLVHVELPATVDYIGKGAFKDCDALLSVLIEGTPSVIEENAFYGCSRLTVYGTGEGVGTNWDERWDPSQRPAVWGVELAEDADSGAVYVASVTTGNVTYPHARYGYSGPARTGYTFVGWSRTEGASTADYTAAQLEVLPAGTKVYAVFEEVPEEDDESWREEYNDWLLDYLFRLLQEMISVWGT